MSVNPYYNAQGNLNNTQIQNTFMFGNVSAGIIVSENEKVAERLAFLKEKLSPRLLDATYGHQEKRPCAPETRVDILEEIQTWIKDVSQKSECFYWLSGAPGVGKSAITASIAKHCIQSQILGAQFFINRDDAATTDPRALFPTICWQLCQSSPQVAIAMENTLRNQLTLVDDISDDQAAKLFVDAIETAAVSDRSKPVVIVIDALDETDTRRLRDLAQIFSKVVADLPRGAKVFISSRTENDITRPFSSLRGCERAKFRYLAPEQSIKEVSCFMEKEVRKILEDYEMDWTDWGDERMKKLSSQASGLYIWAETALKFLRAEIQNSGTTCFRGLSDMLTTTGMDDINTLYLNILRRTCKPGKWEYQRFHRIVGAILVCQTPLSIDKLGELLNLKDPVYSNSVDLVHFARQYRTVLVNHTDKISGLVVPKMHKSFADFITSERALEFRVDKSASHGELALRCLELFNDLHAYFKGRGESSSRRFPIQSTYACRYWQLHLTRMVTPDLKDDAEERSENDITGDDTKDLLANPRDVKDLKLAKEEIEGMGLSSLAFSFDGAQIASANGQRDIQILDTRTGSVITSLIGHENRVTNVGFSPDGTQLLSGSEDHTVRIWDVQTGRVLHVLRGHTHPVWHAAFSHDGRTVITSSGDKTVRTWNSTTGQQLNVFKGHKKTPWYCEFSPNDQRIASFRFGHGEITVWDVNSGSLISKFNYNQCLAMSFCSCGNHIMSRNWAGEIKLWDAESGEQLSGINSTSSTNARLAFVVDSEQESANAYIHVPSSISGYETPCIYSLETEYGNIWGVVENGRGAWISSLQSSYRVLDLSAGATRMKAVEIPRE